MPPALIDVKISAVTKAALGENMNIGVELAARSVLEKQYTMDKMQIVLNLPSNTSAEIVNVIFIFNDSKGKFYIVIGTAIIFIEYIPPQIPPKIDMKFTSTDVT